MNYVDEISSTWLESLREITLLTGEIESIIERRTAQLWKFKAEIDALAKLGWWEHTSDWDPYLVIKMKDGSTIETSFGYASFFIGSQDGTELKDGAISCGTDKNESQYSHIHLEDVDNSDNEITTPVEITQIVSIGIRS